MDFITVTALNKKIHKNLSNNFTNIKVKGEISRPVKSKRGHIYFDLKDEKSKVACVLYKYMAKRNIEPKEGLEVIVKGTAAIYQKNGSFNLQVARIDESGEGNLYLQYQKLKEKLQKERLFEKHRPIPEVPKRIGVITAPTGAVIHDIITTVKRRWPFCEILLFPSLVQGDEAASDIIKQLKRADDFDLDVIIIGRGGGSLEDLWCFNSEKLAKEVYKAKTPIISAVGHENDHTILDDVADLRAPTPTAAAEMVVPNITDRLNKLQSLKGRLNQSLNFKLNQSRRDLDYIIQKRIINNPEILYLEKSRKLEILKEKLQSTSEKLIISRESELKHIKNQFRYFSNNLQTSKKIQLDKTTQKLQNSSKQLINTKQIQLDKTTQKLQNSSKQLINTKQIRFERTAQKLENTSKQLLNAKENSINQIKNNYILKNPQKIVKNKKQEYLNLVEKIELLNPRKTLKRGYTLTKSEGKVIISSKHLKTGDRIEIEFDDGTINAKVE